MKLKLNLYQKLKLLYVQRKCYSSIEDLPILVWFKIHEGEGLGLLNKKKAVKSTIYHDIIFSRIHDQFIKEIGLSKEYLHYLEQLKAIGMMKCDLCIVSSPIKKIQLKIQEDKIEKITTIKGTNYRDLIKAVGKEQGYSVWNVTTSEFYSYLKVNGK